LGKKIAKNKRCKQNGKDATLHSNGTFLQVLGHTGIN